MICKYKATIPGNKVFMRVYEIDSEDTLFSLHEFLQNDLGFSPDQMVLFTATDKSGKTVKKFGLFDMGDGSMDKITLDSLISGDMPVIRYVFNLMKNLFIELAFISRSEYDPRRDYPRTIIEKGMNPDQFSEVYEDYGEYAETDTEDGVSYLEEELPENREWEGN